MPAFAPSIPRDDQRIRGIRFRIVSISCFALMAALAKLASDGGASTAEILFYRNGMALPVVLAALVAGPGIASVRTGRPGAHFSRALIGIGSMLLTFQGLVLLPLADATAIGFSAPLFATLLSALVLAEPVRRHRWTAIAIGLVGVLIVMRPGGQQAPLGGLLMALGGAFTSALATIAIRRIGTTEPATTTVFWFTLAGTIATAAAMPFAARGHDPLTWAALIATGLVGGAAQMAMTASLRDAPVSVLAPFDYLGLPWSIFYGWLLFSTAPSVATLAGAALIVASGLYTVHRERRLHLAENASRATPPMA